MSKEKRPSGENQYVFQAANEAPEETVRLDDIHEGIKEYMDHRLSFAPLDDMQPARILELGSGSGAWAIQAAKTFPNATVLAVDISPIPPRPLPQNLVFQKADLTKPFPFSGEKFDIIHTRFVMMHLPNGEDVLRRTYDLVKPGGWLLVDEPNDENMRDGENPIGPGMRAFCDAWFNLAKSRGVNPGFGGRLEGLLKGSGCFSEVYVKKVTIPYGGHAADPAEKRLGEVWMALSQRIARNLPSSLKQVITPEMAEKHLAELEDPTRRITTEMYFTWSHKK